MQDLYIFIYSFVVHFKQWPKQFSDQTLSNLGLNSLNSFYGNRYITVDDIKSRAIFFISVSQ